MSAGSSTIGKGPLMPNTPNGSAPRPPDGDWLGTPYLTFKREGAFAICTLDRPAARNAMTPAMYFGIRYAISRVNTDPELAGLLITGTGDVFAPGGDLGQGGEDDWMDFASTLGMDVTPFDVLRQSPKPVMAAVNGLCQGGGLQIAMCSDLAVISERATFRVPELFRGIADTYYSQMLARLIGPVRTRDLMFTGRTLSAAEAQDWGMVARVVPHDDLFDVSRELLAQCCRTAPAARGVIKASLDNYMGLYDRIGMQASLFGPETREGFMAFKEKRSPSWVHQDLQVQGRL
jgi:enoyl-CoA hydratase